MDSILNSRKRNNPSSPRPHPFSGALTRSRSQLFLHRNRSGQLRSDRSRRKQEPFDRSRCSRSPPMDPGSNTRKQSSEDDDGDDDDDDDMILIKDLCKKPKPNREPASTTGGDEDLSRVLIKDLRARRVYSPQLSAGGACSDLVKKVVTDCRDQKIAELGFGLSSSVESEREVDGLVKGFSSEGQSKDEIRIKATESPGLGLSCEAPNFDQGNDESSNESSKLEDHKQCDGENGGDCTEKIEDLKEGLVLTTPPDAEICGNSEVNGDEGKRVEEVPIKDKPFTGNAEENAAEGFGPKDSAVKSKSVLRPRFQGKLFKAPSSVSYRRLFPYLMDIMRDDSGMLKLDHCQKDEKGINGQELQPPLSSQTQEASKNELKTDSCTVRDTSQSGASEGDAFVAPVNELSYSDGFKLTSSHCLCESPMQLNMKGVAGECLSVLSVKEKCLSESKDDSTGVKDVGNALHNGNLKQEAEHNNTPDYAKATNNSCCTSEQLGVLNEECELTTPPDAVIHDKSEVNVSQLESMPREVYDAKPMDLTTSTQENAGEGCCLKTNKRKDSVLKSKSVPRPNLHRKIFKTPGSVSYRRMLPFFRDLTKDDYGTSKLGYQSPHQKYEVDMHAKKFKLPLSSLSQEASIVDHKMDSGLMHGTVGSDVLVNNMVNPVNELSHDNQPKLTSSQDLPELPMQLDAKEVVHECLSAPSLNEHIDKVEIVSKDKCLSDSKFDHCSVMVDFLFAKNVANAVHNDDIQTLKHRESPPKAQNLLHINSNVPNLTLGHQSNKETGFIIDYDERKQFTSPEKHESVGRYPSEGQTLNHLDPNMPDAEENGRSSDDTVLLNHVSVSNEERRPASENTVLENSDMAGHGVDKAGSVMRGVVYGPRLEGSNNKNADCVVEISNGSESKSTLVLNHCSRSKLLKHAGSVNYKRLLPFTKDNSYASLNDHYPRLQKCLAQTPLLPFSASDLQVAPISDSNGCVHCRANSGTQQQTGLHASNLDNDSSSSRSQPPESQSSHDSRKLIQLPDEKVVLNGRYKPDHSPDPPIYVNRIDLPITPVGPIINEVTTRGEATSALPKSSVHSEVKGISSLLISSNGEKPPGNDCFQRLSQLKVLEQLRVPAVGFKKGILKRNPSGCRGLCTCLNCVSFRLHAERAFEFSRNQFLDAEEVALDLIKELSNLRNTLERSTDSVNGNHVVDGSQVKEACMEAFAAEQLAKDRLSQMNDDLNIHCRIPSLQRARVRFAHHVEEKVIQPGK